MKPTVMLVDDDRNVLNALRRELQSIDMECEAFISPQDALKRINTLPVEVVIADYRMPQMNGVEFLSQVSDVQPDAMRLLLSGHADVEGLQGAINRAQIFRFIFKPWNRYDLQNTVQLAVEHRRILVENRRLADRVREQDRTLAAMEELNPGITQVRWGADGSVILGN